MIQPIPMDIRLECIRLYSEGKTPKEIYDEYYSKVIENPCDKNAFRSMLCKWRKHEKADPKTLYRGTYEGFTAHGATVQVNAEGQVIQAWIKQIENDFDSEDFIEAIGKIVPKHETQKQIKMDSDYMLELPLFDMHWGIAYKEHYAPVLDELIKIIRSNHWQDIYIPVGQDLFHNDSVAKGVTTKGTQIERVDMKRAVKDAGEFIFSLIDSAIDNANNVHVFYSPGNHDRTVSWMFMQVLLQRYGPEIVDDELEFRKVITFGSNAIMITHGDSRRANPNNLAHIFPIEFPKAFGDAKIREVHAGHLHTESDTDVFGVMVRRLAANNITDEWTNMEDYVGTNKRFMVFEWSKDKLKSIHYV